MAEQGYELDAESIQAIKADHDFLMSLVESPNKRRQVLYPSGQGGGVQYGIALTAVSPASNRLTGSAFTFQKLPVDGSVAPQTDPKTLKEQVDSDDDPVETKGVNRYLHISGAAGSFVTVGKVNGEWTLITLEDVCVDDA